MPITTSAYSVDLPTNTFVLIRVLGLAALLEEGLFRVIPWLFLYIIRKISKRNEWVERINILIAIVLSIVFGLSHSSNYTSPDVYVYLSNSIQIVGGLLYWYILEKEGIGASIVLHFLYNLIAILPGSF